MTTWRVILRQPKTGEELALEGWTNIQITENFDGVSATIDVPGERAELSFISELTTNVLFYSDKILAYQLRIMDSEDSFTDNAHTVSLTCQSYESILARRVLFKDYETPGSIDQHEVAWWFVNYTQGFEDLGIRKAPNWIPSTQKRDRIIQKGKTIVEAIDEVAKVDNGFDWWIDQNLKMHTQTPRMVFDTGLDLRWGARVQTVTRSSASDTYDSVVLVVGATNDTQLPSGATYPPPPPALVSLPTKPYGRWERAYSYGDVITAAGVLAKAKWHLGDSSVRRATYRIGLAHGVWNQTHRPGGLLYLRVKSLPRLDFRVRVRIEELSIHVGPDGQEEVEFGTRAETTEQEITPTPWDAVVTPLAGPPEEIEVDVVPSGKSPTIAVTSHMGFVGALIRRLEERISRNERK